MYRTVTRPLSRRPQHLTFIRSSFAIHWLTVFGWPCEGASEFNEFALHMENAITRKNIPVIRYPGHMCDKGAKINFIRSLNFWILRRVLHEALLHSHAEALPISKHPTNEWLSICPGDFMFCRTLLTTSMLYCKVANEIQRQQTIGFSSDSYGCFLDH